MVETALQLTTPSAVKDAPHVGPTWSMSRGTIDGVEIHEVEGVVTRNGVTVESWRRAWETGCRSVDQIIHATMRPGAISAWHLHRARVDGVLVVVGALRIVLFDARSDSTTKGALDVLTFDHTKPTLLIIPPAIWHGVQVLGDEPACFMNCFDRAYDPSDPDEWRLPADSDEVPYRFT